LPRAQDLIENRQTCARRLEQKKNIASKCGLGHHLSMNDFNAHHPWSMASAEREALAIAVLKGACQTLQAAGFHPEEVMALFGQMAVAPEQAGRTLRRSRRSVDMNPEADWAGEAKSSQPG
jgi:hypothetical protein